MSFLKSLLHTIGVGYDNDGYSKSGYDSDGNDRDGYDRDGFKGARTTHKWNRDGVNKYTGTKYDKWGKDQEGYDKDGYCVNGWNKIGIHKETGTKYAPDGYDREWYHSNGWHHSGRLHKLTGTVYDPYGYTKEGFDKEFPQFVQGSDIKEYNEACNNAFDFGYDREGWNRDGWNKDGINKFTGTKFDQNGFPRGYDLDGWNKGGWDRAGNNKATSCKFDDKGFRKDGSCNPAIVVKQKNGQEEYDLAVKCLHNRHGGRGGEFSRLVESAAKQGHTHAQYLLGLLYECGKYVSKNYPSGVSFGPHSHPPIPKYYEPEPSSLFLMEDGDIPPKFEKAIEWYLLAARKGHETARLRLKNLDSSIDVLPLIMDIGQNEDSCVEIQNIVEKNQIAYVVHFTRIDNLNSIISHGLKTRQDIKKLNITSLFNDEYRFDKQENSISCSIEFPNYKMLYKLQQDNPFTEWVIVLLNPCVLWKKTCAFSITNAAHSRVTSIPIDQRKGAEAFQKIFDDVPGKPSRSNLGIPANYPTDPQAEILVLNNIEPQYILGFVTQREKVVDELKGEYPEFDFSYNKSMFTPRKDYAHWRKN